MCYIPFVYYRSNIPVPALNRKSYQPISLCFDYFLKNVVVIIFPRFLLILPLPSTFCKLIFRSHSIKNMFLVLKTTTAVFNTNGLNTSLKIPARCQISPLEWLCQWTLLIMRSNFFHLQNFIPEEYNLVYLTRLRVQCNAVFNYSLNWRSECDANWRSNDETRIITVLGSMLSSKVGLEVDFVPGGMERAFQIAYRNLSPAVFLLGQNVTTTWTRRRRRRRTFVTSRSHVIVCRLVLSPSNASSVARSRSATP